MATSTAPTTVPVRPRPAGIAGDLTEARVVAILRHLLSCYDDVVYRVHPSAQTVVTRSAAALKSARVP